LGFAILQRGEVKPRRRVIQNNSEEAVPPTENSVVARNERAPGKVLVTHGEAQPSPLGEGGRAAENQEKS
jgi:hypothetical protein